MKQPTASQVEFASRWVQGIVLTFIVGFAILGYLAIRIYRESPPVPARVVSESGKRSSPARTFALVRRRSLPMD